MSSPEPGSGCLQLLRRMPCFALQDRGGKLNCLYAGFVVDGRRGTAATALGHHVTGAGFAATALGGHTQFELNFVKTHARMCMARDLAIRNSVAYTNDHGCKQLWLAIDVMQKL